MLMKTILSGIIISLLITVSAHSQGFWEWTDPAPLSDSLTDNINPFLYYNGTSFYMVWEKPVNSQTTTIWFRNITDQDPDIELLNTQNVHYKNPKILGFMYSSTFYLFYETNEIGNDDIYYIYYDETGTFSEPVAFANTSLNENHFFPDHDTYYGRENLGMVWLENNSVYYCYLSGKEFSNPILIDSANCENPKITAHGGIIVWEKQTSFNRSISYSSKSGNVWSEPLIAYDEYKSQNLKCDKIDRSLFTWTIHSDSVWKIAVAQCFGGPFNIEIHEISSADPFSPAVTFYFYPYSMGFKWPIEHFLAFPYSQNDTIEIFMNPEVWGNPIIFENFSNSQTNNKNPDFFYSPHENPDCDGIYLVWETYRNDHWQLYYSTAIQQCWGNISEDNFEDNNIQFHPNPFTHEITLEFTLDTRSKVTIEVYNNRGVLITTIAEQSFDQGTHQLRWDGAGLAVGVYIIKMTVGDMVYTAKVIKLP